MISFVYFDLGGVVIRDFSGTNKWQEMKRDMGINDKNEEAFDDLWNKYRSRICVDFDVDNLTAQIKKECRIKLPKKYSMLADFVNRFEKNLPMWPILEKVRNKCRLGLLTNAYPRMLNAVFERNIMPPVSWDVTINSCEVGFQKPDREIFEIAELKAKAKKSEILFVENGPENVKAAAERGWQIFLYDSASPVDSNRRLSKLF